MEICLNVVPVITQLFMQLYCINYYYYYFFLCLGGGGGGGGDFLSINNYVYIET